MAIDLDSFFEGAKGSGDKLKVEKGVKLDFQKEVEDRIHKAQVEAEKGDFKFLSKIYEEVKKFEEDLPSKFLDIEKESNIALKNIGKQYSSEFLVKAKENMLRLTDLIKGEIIEFDKNTSGNNFAIMLEHFNKALKFYNSFPKEFFKERTIVGLQLREREILMTKKLEQYKQTELESIKKKIHNDVMKLNTLLRPGEVKAIEETIGNLHYMMSKSPKIFLASLTREKIVVSESIIKAENFLQKEYERVFDDKEKIIRNLTESFHSHHLNNDLQNTLTIYNQIMIEFESIPEVFLERKMLIYTAINDLYAHLNNLIIKNSVSNFLESYSHSKVLEEARDYIEHARITNSYDINNLVLIKNKLIKVPQKYSSDKILLEKQIAALLERKKHNSSKFSSKSKEAKTVDFKSTDKSTKDFNLNQKIKTSDHSFANEKVNKKLLQEIDMYYKRLRETQDSNEAKLMYRKIHFYLDLVPMPQKEKDNLLVKVSNILKNKTGGSK